MSDKEARVYVAMLELGPASVQEISQRSDVNRATTYLMLDALKERGLVSSYEDAKKTVYVAETPKKLVDLIEQEARSIDEKREKVVFFVPELEALYRTQRNKPVVRFYEGEEGLRSLRDYLTRIKTTIFDSFLRLNRELLEVAKHDQDRRLGIFDPHTKYRTIYVPDEDVEVPFFKPEGLRVNEIRFASTVPFDFDGEIGILDSVTYLMLTLPKPMSCVMESEKFSKRMGAVFELTWAGAEKERVNFQRPR